MRQSSVAELRANVKELLAAVEGEDTVRVLRRGRPVADIVPVRAGAPAWKRTLARISRTGLSLGREVLRDRAGKR